MSRKYVVHLAGNIIIDATDEAQAKELAKQKLDAALKHLEAISDFNIESVTEMQITS